MLAYGLLTSAKSNVIASRSLCRTPHDEHAGYNNQSASICEISVICVKKVASVLAITEENLERAMAALRAGEVLGLPTETVYGLAADASNANAVARIFAMKGRPADHPLIVHLASASDARAWTSEWTETAEKLANAFWPGPMTLIVKRASHVLDAVTGGQNTVGLRVPSHPVAQRVLKEFASSARGESVEPRGLAAPSANKFGHVSPTSAQHVASEFADDELLILDGGNCDVGVESTIIDVSGTTPRILRPGRVRAHEIERVLAKPLAKTTTNAPRVSGSLDSHYAPHKTTVMLDGDALEIFLAASRDAGKRVGLIFHSPRFTKAKANERIELAHENAAKYEHDIYAVLRRLDESCVDLIAVESPPSSSDWDAVNDRLRRATHK
jgi:L-threonylcarbamoyladenylate synthase